MNQISDRLKVAIETNQKATRVRIVDQKKLVEIDMRPEQLVAMADWVRGQLPSPEAKVTRMEDIPYLKWPRVKDWRDIEEMAEKNTISSWSDVIADLKL